MHIPVLVKFVAAAIAGAFVFNAYEKKVQAKPTAKPSQVASELGKGRSYVVQMMIDPKNPQWGGIRDLATGSALIKATFEQLGWKFLMAPMIRDANNAALFASGKPDEWVFNATWMRDEKYMAFTPGWVGMALPYLLPTI